MYAIFEDGGRQYKVTAGDKIYVDRRELSEGQDTIEFESVLLLGEGADAKIGQPLLDGVKVVAKIDAEVKARKITTIKYNRRKGYRRKIGHRQKHLQVTISDIIGQ